MPAVLADHAADIVMFDVPPCGPLGVAGGHRVIPVDREGIGEFAPARPVGTL